MYENPLRNVSRCVFRGRKSGALSAGAAADRRKETGMAKKKYRDDYRLTERIDDRGRTRRDIEYIGGHYRYILAPAALRRDRRSVLAVCGIGAAAFICALLPRSAASNTIYITLPFAFTALPLGIAIETVLSAPRGEEPLERRQADRLKNRYPAAAISIAALSAVSLLGEGIYALRGGPLSGGDGVFALCAALLAACGVFLWNKRRSFDTRND